MHYRSKETIEAFLWTGGPDQAEDPAWICDALKNGVVRIEGEGNSLRMTMMGEDGCITCAIPGDCIVRYSSGFISYLRPEQLEKDYEQTQPAPASTK